MKARATEEERQDVRGLLQGSGWLARSPGRGGRQPTARPWEGRPPHVSAPVGAEEAEGDAVLFRPCRGCEGVVARVRPTALPWATLCRPYRGSASAHLSCRIRLLSTPCDPAPEPQASGVVSMERNPPRRKWFPTPGWSAGWAFFVD